MSWRGKILLCFMKEKSRFYYIGLFSVTNVVNLLQEIYEEQTFFIRAYL